MEYYDHLFCRVCDTEMYLPTLLGVLSSLWILFFLHFLQIKSYITTVGIKLKDQRW